MSVSDSRLAFRDCDEIFEKASAAGSGCRVHVVDYSAAVNLRMRLHQCRKIDRRDNKRTYDPDHPLYGCSAFDDLVVRLREIDGSWWVYLERRTAGILKIESIDDLEPQHQLSHEPVRQIEHKPQAEAPRRRGVR